MVTSNITFYLSKWIKAKIFGTDDLSEEDKKSIDRGLADVKANRVKSYKEVMQKIKNRLPKS